MLVCVCLCIYIYIYMDIYIYIWIYINIYYHGSVILKARLPSQMSPGRARHAAPTAKASPSTHALRPISLLSLSHFPTKIITAKIA